MARIQVVDDVDLLRRVLRRALEAEGHAVGESADGGEALDACRREAPDLVVTDIAMPRIDGLQLIRELRSEYPALKLIAISSGWHGNDGGDALAAARELGAHRVFRKPFSLKELLAAVRDLTREVA